MKNSGFTLVELLGTIVILSIIVIIVTITVDTTISNSKKKLSKVQIANIEEAAEVYYLKEGLKTYSLDDESFEMCVNLEYLIDNDYIENEEIKNLKNSNKLEGSVKIKYESESFIYKYQENSCKTDYVVLEDNALKLTNLLSVATISEEIGVTSIDECATSGKCEPGTAFAIKVNDEETYKFYVISDDGKRITLIMNQNLGDNVDWNDGDYSNGPITSLDTLEDRTSNWANINGQSYAINIDDVDNCDYDNEYKCYASSCYCEQIQIKRVNARARMINYSEVTNIAKKNSNIIPNFLYENLEGDWSCDSDGDCYDSGNKPHGYWFSSSFYDYDGIGDYLAYLLINDNRNYYATNGFSSFSTGYDNYLIDSNYYNDTSYLGVRPVIELYAPDRNEVLVSSFELSEDVIPTFQDVDYEVVSTVYPINANNKNLVWSSSDTSVATVDQNGIITTHDFGTATITAKTTDGSNISKKITVRTPKYTNGILKSDSDCINSGICANGTMVNVQVNSSINYNFYVIADTGEELTMIMDKNLGSSQWITEEDYNKTTGLICSLNNCLVGGPITALSNLEALTSNWINVELFDYTLIDSSNNYSSKEITNVRSRLLSLNDLDLLGCRENMEFNCKYLTENLDEYGGYWISDTWWQNSNWILRIANYNIESYSSKSISDYGVEIYWTWRTAGLRPVIKVSK